MSMNHITVMGTIVRGPEFRMTPNGIPTCNLSIAVTRPARTEGAPEVTDYIRIVAWRTLAEKVNENVQKGDLVVVEGRLSARSYETQDGQRRKTVEVEASAVEPVRGAGKVGAAKQHSDAPEGFDDDFSDFEASAPAPAPARKSAATKPAAPAADLDDEIPF
jgi:single-strand DNA-binding protein